MANYQKKKIQETKDSNFGNYNEYHGGGTPIMQGGGRGAWHKAGEPGHRDDQPRTEDGKFTYNSVNGKGLSSESDPTRGKTVNPLLTGGKNGVKIKDVEKQFSEKSGAYWDKYKGEWYKEGGEFIVGSKTKVSAKPIWQVAYAKYDVKKGEFEGESENWSTKIGAKSKEEKAAMQQMKASGETEQAVLNKEDGSIKQKPGTKPVESLKTKEPSLKSGEVKTTPVAPSVPQTQEKEEQVAPETASAPTSAPVSSQKSGVKYSADDVGKVKDYLSKKFADNPKLSKLLSSIDSMTPEQLDKQIDMWVSKGADFGLSKKEEDSESIKKIKEMGFDEK